MDYQILSFGSYTLTVATVFGLLFVWLTAWIVVRLLSRFINRGRMLTMSDQGRRHSLFLIVQYVIWTMAAVAMLEVAGFRVSVLLAGSAALLVGLGLGVQQIFRDIMSGIFLLFEGTIEVGDIMQIDGQVTRVSEINLRTSKLVTRDGLTMIVPNHKFITENVINWTHRDKEPSRFAILAGANYEADETLVRTLMLASAQEHPDVINDDAIRTPKVRLIEFADERMIFEMIFWTYRKFDVDNVRSDLRFAIREKFRKAGIVMNIPA